MKDLILVVIVLLVVAAAFYLLSREESAPEAPPSGEPAAPEPAERTAAEPPPIRYPIRPALDARPADEDAGAGAPFEPVPPLPALDHSDAPLLDALDEWFERDRLRDLFVLENLIRNFVVTVDNMTSAKLPQKYALGRSPPGKFAVSKRDDERLFLAAENYRRYDAYVALAAKLDTEKMVKLYARYYPLFQKAYAELGYGDRYFNDRLVDVIDHLLEAPEIDGPVALERPKVYYTFADPELEALSAGRKILLRIGPQNASAVKAKLRELRRALIALSQPAQD